MTNRTKRKPLVKKTVPNNIVKKMNEAIALRCQPNLETMVKMMEFERLEKNPTTRVRPFESSKLKKKSETINFQRYFSSLRDTQNTVIDNLSKKAKEVKNAKNKSKRNIAIPFDRMSIEGRARVDSRRPLGGTQKYKDIINNAWNPVFWFQVSPTEKSTLSKPKGTALKRIGKTMCLSTSSLSLDKAAKDSDTIISSGSSTQKIKIRNALLGIRESHQPTPSTSNNSNRDSTDRTMEGKDKKQRVVTVPVKPMELDVDSDAYSLQQNNCAGKKSGFRYKNKFPKLPNLDKQLKQTQNEIAEERLDQCLIINDVKYRFMFRPNVASKIAEKSLSRKFNKSHYLMKKSPRRYKSAKKTSHLDTKNYIKHYENEKLGGWISGNESSPMLSPCLAMYSEKTDLFGHNKADVMHYTANSNDVPEIGPLETQTPQVSLSVENQAGISDRSSLSSGLCPAVSQSDLYDRQDGLFHRVRDKEDFLIPQDSFLASLQSANYYNDQGSSTHWSDDEATVQSIPVKKERKTPGNIFYRYDAVEDGHAQKSSNTADCHRHQDHDSPHSSSFTMPVKNKMRHGVGHSDPPIHSLTPGGSRKEWPFLYQPADEDDCSTIDFTSADPLVVSQRNKHPTERKFHSNATKRNVEKRTPHTPSTSQCKVQRDLEVNEGSDSDTNHAEFVRNCPPGWPLKNCHKQQTPIVSTYGDVAGHIAEGDTNRETLDTSALNYDWETDTVIGRIVERRIESDTKDNMKAAMNGTGEGHEKCRETDSDLQDIQNSTSNLMNENISNSERMNPSEPAVGKTGSIISQNGTASSMSDFGKSSLVENGKDSRLSLRGEGDCLSASPRNQNRAAGTFSYSYIGDGSMFNPQRNSPLCLIGTTDQVQRKTHWPSSIFPNKTQETPKSQTRSLLPHLSTTLKSEQKGTILNKHGVVDLRTVEEIENERYPVSVLSSTSLNSPQAFNSPVYFVPRKEPEKSLKVLLKTSKNTKQTNTTERRANVKRMNACQGKRDKVSNPGSLYGNPSELKLDLFSISSDDRSREDHQFDSKSGCYERISARDKLILPPPFPCNNKRGLPKSKGKAKVVEKENTKIFPYTKNKPKVPARFVLPTVKKYDSESFIDRNIRSVAKPKEKIKSYQQERPTLNLPVIRCFDVNAFPSFPSLSIGINSKKKPAVKCPAPLIPLDPLPEIHEVKALLKKTDLYEVVQTGNLDICISSLGEQERLNEQTTEEVISTIARSNSDL